MPDKNKPFLSIIVPVYNVEKYLCECLDSILLQGFQDYEVILIDDGSSDGSPSICDEYDRNYERVTVVHKENGGLSEARNDGIHIATGQYLLFIDSDDFIATDSLGKIVAQIENDGDCDILLLTSVVVFSDGSCKGQGHFYEKDQIYKKSRSDVLQYFNHVTQFPFSAWIKLIRRQLVIDKDLYFTKGIVCEDFDHMMGLLIAAESFNCCDFPYYNYRSFREGSISGSSQHRLFHDMFYVIQKWSDLLKNDSGDYVPFLYEILAFEYTMLLWYYYSLCKSDKAVYKKKMKKYAHLMALSKDRRVLIIKIVYKILGLRVVSGLIHFYFSRKYKNNR